MTENTNTNEPIDRIAGEIQATTLDDETVNAATDRVWAKLQTEFSVDAPLRSCADVQSVLPAFVAGELGEAKAMLVGDHTRECVPCRRALMELKGGGDQSRTQLSASLTPRGLPRWLKAAAAVVLMIGGGFIAYTTGSNLLADRFLTAQVASIEGTLQLVEGDEITNLGEGDTLRARQRVRTTKRSGAFLRLDDGSMVEMAPRSELELQASRRGTNIELGRGNIIVHAADQGRGRLAVTTNECEVAVKGTIFAVNHGLKGSRVSVIEGEVEVRQGANYSLLHPGDQVTTDQRLRSVAIEDEIAWSANAEEHRELLSELTRLHHEVAKAVDISTPRTSTRLLDLAPEGTVFYLAMPNLTEGLGAARQVFDSRLADSEILRDWWQREIVAKNIDTQIEESLDSLQFLGEAVGDEVVVALAGSAMSDAGTPLFLAELTDPQSFRAFLDEHLANHPDGPPPVQILDDPYQEVAAGTEVVIWVADDLVVAARNAEQIQQTAARLDGTAAGFAGVELHQRLTESYAGGVEWLFGIDLELTIAEAVADGTPEELAMMERYGLLDATTLVFERRRADVGSEIEADIRFSGARRGVAAWLAEPAPLATLDFVSSDAYLVTAVAAKDGVELFDELLGMVADVGPEALSELRDFETEAGINLRDDLAAAIGGEGAFAIDGPILPIPSWKLILEVYDPATLNHTIRTVVDRANDELAANDREPITITEETFGRLRYTSITHPSSPVPFTYTMTEGFLIAGSNRAVIERAIQVRASGMGLTGSAVFRELLPDNGFTDCSAVFYRNLAPLLGVLPSGAMGEDLGAYEDLLRETAAPGLFCVYGLGDRILISGTGPSLMSLAPLMGMQSLIDLDEFTAESTEDDSDRLSSQS